jgi:hypothetical protein
MIYPYSDQYWIFQLKCSLFVLEVFERTCQQESPPDLIPMRSMLMIYKLGLGKGGIRKLSKRMAECQC